MGQEQRGKSQLILFWSNWALSIYWKSKMRKGGQARTQNMLRFVHEQICGKHLIGDTSLWSCTRDTCSKVLLWFGAENAEVRGWWVWGNSQDRCLWRASLLFPSSQSFILLLLTTMKLALLMILLLFPTSRCRIGLTGYKAKMEYVKLTSIPRRQPTPRLENGRVSLLINTDLGNMWSAIRVALFSPPPPLFFP